MAIFFRPPRLPPSIQPAAFFSSSPKVSAPLATRYVTYFGIYEWGIAIDPRSPGSSFPCSWFVQSPTEDCVNVSVSFFFIVVIIIVFSFSSSFFMISSIMIREDA